MGDHEAVDRAVIQAVKDLGEIDILINNVCYSKKLLFPQTMMLISRLGWPRSRHASALSRAEDIRHRHHEQYQCKWLHVCGAFRSEPLHAI